MCERYFINTSQKTQEQLFCFPLPSNRAAMAGVLVLRSKISGLCILVLILTHCRLIQALCLWAGTAWLMILRYGMLYILGTSRSLGPKARTGKIFLKRNLIPLGKLGRHCTFLLLRSSINSMLKSQLIQMTSITMCCM